MYILAFDFQKKTINMYLKLEICVMSNEFSALKFVKTNQTIIYG